MATEGDTWYRFEDRRYSVANEFGDHAATRVEVQEMTFTVQRVTPKGVWVRGRFEFEKPRFVLNDARRKYACSTREEALKSLLAKKEAQARILGAQLKLVDQARAKALLLLNRPIEALVS